MSYSVGTPLIGSYEKILASMQADILTVSGIAAAIRQWDGVANIPASAGGKFVMIDTGSTTQATWLCGDLSRNKSLINVVCTVNDLAVSGGQRTISTTLNAFFAAVESALNSNRGRVLSGSGRQAWDSQVGRKVTVPMANIAVCILFYEVTWFSAQ